MATKSSENFLSIRFGSVPEWRVKMWCTNNNKKNVKKKNHKASCDNVISKMKKKS